jgi:hypothetical protein
VKDDLSKYSNHEFTGCFQRPMGHCKMQINNF